MTKSAKVLVSLGSLALLGSAATPALAGPWVRHHPRQAEVLGRTHHQVARINEERREGDLTGSQARALRAQDRAIAQEDHADARANGGHITKSEQHQLNQQLNAESRVIGR